MRSSRVCRWLLPMVLGVTAHAAVAASALEVRDVRLWRGQEHTRIVFDLNAPPTYSMFTLDNPDRVVLDIRNCTLGPAAAAKLGQLPLGGTPVRAIRHGIRAGVNLRVVVDVDATVKPRAFALEANEKRGDRLVLDLLDRDPGAGRPAVTKSVANLEQRDVIIAIDAGHGGEDPGASGPGGLREKNVVLAIARELHRRFSAESGFSSRLVRDGDYYVGLKKRREIARAAQADLLVSIHADAFSSPRVKGASVYALSQRGASSNFARFLAQRENAADLVGGVSLSDKDDLLAEVLYDMSQTNTLDVSLRLGDRVLREVDGVARLHRRKVEQAAFQVLRSADIPSILVETGFISNPEEARLLGTERYQRKMAAALHRGIRAWFMEHPPEDTLLAKWKAQGGREYIIARGDTLSEIAEKFNISEASLRSRNSLSGSLIRVGQKLIIPAS